MKFVALLRGINVGGNNKVPMAALKLCFENLGFKNVITYINSGNVIFETIETNKVVLVRMCEQTLENQFGFRIVCAVITADELIAALQHAPAWWDLDNASKHNAIFVIAPKKVEEIMAEVGAAKPDYEKVAAHHPIIFWSASVETFSRTRYSKLIGTRAYKSVTIRNANTTKKIAEICRER